MIRFEIIQTTVGESSTCPCIGIRLVSKDRTTIVASFVGNPTKRAILFRMDRPAVTCIMPNASINGHQHKSGGIVRIVDAACYSNRDSWPLKSCFGHGEGFGGLILLLLRESIIRTADTM